MMAHTCLQQARRLGDRYAGVALAGGVAALVAYNLRQWRRDRALAVALRTLGEVTGAGAWGDGHEVKAVDYFMRSIAICKEIGNELEVAKSYLAFSNYVFSSAHYKHNADIQREAQKLKGMAEEIFERHRITSRPGGALA